ncbi:MAG: hypothetical protein ABR514_09995 [Chthoniobacterales bacterium]
MPAVSLHALLAHSIDYAGMFPPCSLPLDRAVENHAHYVRSPDAWMLNSFVLPLEKFEAAAEQVSRFDKKHPLRVSALGPRTQNAAEFIAALKAAAQTIAAFKREHVDLIAVPQLEIAMPEDVDLARLREGRAQLSELKLQLFVEAPADSAERTLGLIAQLKDPGVGYKLRTGGVTADAFPSIAQIGAALSAAMQRHVPIKFTAGLHHPLRQFRDEVGTQMHGFLNVLGAAVLAAEHHWDEGQIAQVLEDEGAGSFSFDETIFAWRDWEIATDRIHARRKLVTSFGSCSFDEPGEDLRALNVL